MPGKRVQFDDEIFEAFTAVAPDTGKSFQKVAADAARTMMPSEFESLHVSP